MIHSSRQRQKVFCGVEYYQRPIGFALLQREGNVGTGLYKRFVHRPITIKDLATGWLRLGATRTQYAKHVLRSFAHHLRADGALVVEAVTENKRNNRGGRGNFTVYTVTAQGQVDVEKKKATFTPEGVTPARIAPSGWSTWQLQPDTKALHGTAGTARQLSDRTRKQRETIGLWNGRKVAAVHPIILVRNRVATRKRCATCGSPDASKGRN